MTRGTHEKVVADLEGENDRLEAQLNDLQRSNRALDEERAQLLDEMEDMRQAREALSRDVAKLEKSKSLLTEHLRAREAQVQELSRLKSSYSGLIADLESEVAAGQIEIEQLREGLRLNLAQDILFPSGSVRLNETGAVVLRKVAAQLREIDQRVEVQGHTDDVPLSNSLAGRWGSNWELAAARAAQVVRLFEAEGVDARRLSAVSFGSHAPVADNGTPEGRARNRRIEIRLIPERDAAQADATAAEAERAAPAAP
ncbi:MAG TPA: OmpA family protein [Myxococcota bacterium]